jgi:hypothetical protein
VPLGLPRHDDFNKSIHSRLSPIVAITGGREGVRPLGLGGT